MEELPERETRVGPFATSTVVREPVGVVAGIVPWNGPLWLSMFKLAPALLAGCTIVLKPDPLAPLSSYILAEAISAADLPAGVVSIVASEREAGQHLVTHPGVDKVAFTGEFRDRAADHGDLRRQLETGDARAGRKIGRHFPR